MKGKILIIGGGIIGMTEAAILSEGGWNVCLLERKEIASSASGGNIGQISVIDRTESWHMKLALKTLALYKAISDENDLGYRQEGGSILLEEDKDFLKAEKLGEIMDNYQIPWEILKGQEVRKYIPRLDCSVVKGVFHCPYEGVINPLKTIYYYRNRAINSGVRILENCPVTKIKVSNGEVKEVLTPNGVFSADYVFNCTGAWASEIGGMANLRIGLKWRRGSAMITQPILPFVYGQVCGHELLGGISSAIGGKEEGQLISLGITQADNGGLMIAQATEYTDRENKEISLKAMAKVAKKFLEHFTGAENLEVVRIWSAVTPFSDDGLPFYGYGKSVSNLITVAGFKGAFSTAPAVAAETLKFLEGQSTIFNSDFAPDRKVNGKF